MKNVNFKSLAIGFGIALIALTVMAVTLSDGNFVTTQFTFVTNPNRMAIKDGSNQTNNNFFGTTTVNGDLALTSGQSVTGNGITASGNWVIGAGWQFNGGITLGPSTTIVGDGSGLTNINVGQITGGISTTGQWVSASLGMPPSIQPVYTNGILARYNDSKLIAVDDFESYPAGLLSAASATNGYGWNGAATTLANGVIGTDTTFHTSFPDKYLQLTNGEYIRKLAVGTNWRYLKIGILCAMATNGTSDITTSYMALGVCSSVGGGLGTHFTTQNTSNFYGYVSALNETNGDTFSYTANTGYPYYTDNASGGKAYSWRAQSATNQANVSISNRPLIPIVNTGRRNFIVISLDKTTAGANDIAAQCLIGNEDVSPLRITGFFNNRILGNYISQESGIFVRGTYTLNQLTESNGALDSIDFYWSNATFPLYVYGIYVQVVPD